MQRVQVIQKNVDLLVIRITDTTLRKKAENVKEELQNILDNETQGTGDLSRSVQVQRGTQRGKPILRILTASHGIPFFKGTEAPYAGFPPSAESANRFNVWAERHAFRPRRLSRIIAFGKSKGSVYSDRTDILIRALRNGFNR